MKRLMHILLSITLSLMIIIMGEGVLVVHCNHSGVTKLLTPSNHTCSKRCKPNAPCMQISVIKLSTMSDSHHQIAKYKPVVVVLPWLIQPLHVLTKVVIPSVDSPIGFGCTKHGPPRDYLKLIRVLLI